VGWVVCVVSVGIVGRIGLHQLIELFVSFVFRMRFFGVVRLEDDVMRRG
jgi:hypothetical protein